MYNLAPPIQVYVHGNLIVQGWGTIKKTEGEYSHIIKIQDIPVGQIELPPDSWEQK